MVPATDALSERSCSALRRLKTYLRTTMCQDRLNHCMILYVHKELTDALEITDIGNQFVSNCTGPNSTHPLWKIQITGILLVRKRRYMDIYCCKYMLNSSVL